MGSVDFGGGVLTSAGSSDVFLAQFDWNGNHIWSQRFGDSAYQLGHDLATYGAETVFVTGQFFGSVNFGGDTLTCVGGLDIFVAKFGEPSSSGPSFSLVDYPTIYDDPPYMMVELELQNEGPGDAMAVSAQMGEDISWLRITDAVCYYGDIPEGESSWGVEGDSFTLVLLPDYPGGDIDVWLDVSCEDAAGNSHEMQIELILPDPSTTDVRGPADMMRAEVRLLPNWPNPFNPSTSIPFELSESGHASLRIYDIGGRLVRTLVDDQLAGDCYVVRWDGRDDRGGSLPSGAYFYSLQAGERTLTRKLVLVQ